MKDLIKYKNEEHTKQEWADIFGLKYVTFISRLSRGWTMKEIENNSHNDGYGIEINGVKYKSKNEACKKLNVNYRELEKIINNIQDSSIIIDGVKYKNKSEAKRQLNCSTFTLNKLIGGYKSKSDLNQKYIIDGRQFDNKKQIAEFYGKNYKTFLNKIKLGWTINQIIGLDNPPEKIDINKLDLDKLSEEHKIPKEVIIKKIKRGYTLDKICEPLNNTNNKIVCDDKIFNSVAEMSKFYNIPTELVYNRLNIGWTAEEAVELHERNR